MLVTTAMVGVSRKNEPSLSSASATSRSPAPSRALEPSAAILPPTTTVGSSPAARSTVATSEVVVVLPCEPAMATPYLTRISSANISARPMTGVPLARASRISGLSGEMALEKTTTSAPRTFSGRCPTSMRTPISASRLVMSFAFKSEPETSNSSVCRISARPLMPMPPMPTKCTWRTRPLNMGSLQLGAFARAPRL